jgi:hypothetical protein
VTEGTFSVEWQGETNLDELGDGPRGGGVHATGPSVVVVALQRRRREAAMNTSQPRPLTARLRSSSLLPVASRQIP